MASPKSPYLYCSELCSQEADYVRYARAVHRDGRIARPDVQEALTIRRAWVLSGGYPKRARQLTPEVRAAVFARDGNSCRLCGRPARTIDHHWADRTAGLNDLVNLRALCEECHRRKSLAVLRPIDPEAQPELWRKAQELKSRVLAPSPLRLSDDEQRWRTVYRTISSERRTIIKKL